MNKHNMINLLGVSVLLLILLVLSQAIFNPLFLGEELSYHFELFDIRGLAKGSIYLFTYLLATLFFLILITLKSSKLFFVFLFMIFISFSIDFFIQLLGVSHGFSYAEYNLAMNELGNYQYLTAYIDTIFKAMALAFFLVLVLIFIRVKVATFRVSSVYLFLPLVSMGIIYMACLRIDTFKLSSYPATIKIPNIAISYVQFSKPMVKRTLNPKVETVKSSKIKNIVWIIDESVTGTYLSVNGYEKETTPYLKSLEKNVNFSNFGVVNSVSNCSASSNLFLRIGLNPQSYHKEQIEHLPTIFQYAKRAGYKTWLMDSQTRKDHLQNHLNLYDRESIEHFETLGPDVSRIQRDEESLGQMLNIVNNTESQDKNFIVMVKYGAHFPYLLTYDHQFSPFTPVLESSYGGMNFKNREEQLNTYLNSLHFNVDLYLKKMLEKIDLKESVVFYTSDHGQNILESKDLSRPHCNNEHVVKNEVSVPLFVFGNNAKKIFPKKEHYSYSQIQMFPTTLKLLGYGDELVAEYGKTLREGFAKSSDRKYILSSSQELKDYK